MGETESRRIEEDKGRAERRQGRERPEDAVRKVWERR